MSFEWPENIPNIVDGETTFSANDLNPIINGLANRTGVLRSLIDNLSGSKGLIYTDSGFSENARSAGTMLAWDSATGMYIPAAAAWKNSDQYDSSLVPADSAYVIGMLLTDVAETDGSGTIMAYGWTTDLTVISQALGDTAIAGAYFLGENGKAIPAAQAVTVPVVPIYCFTYTATGKLIFNPRAPELAGHRHFRSQLNWEDWNVNGEFTIPEELEDMQAGESNIIYSCYTPAENSALSDALISNPHTLTLVKNGTIVDTKDWLATTGKIYTAFPVFKTDNLTLHGLIPTAGVDPLVREIVSTCPNLLSVDSVGGRAKLSIITSPTNSELLSGKGVVNISSDKGIEYGPIVQRIFSGPGITIANHRNVLAEEQSVPGSFIISSNQVTDREIDMQVFNLDGVSMGVHSSGIGYTFGIGRVSSITGTFRLPYYEAGDFGLELALLVLGNGSTLPDLGTDVTVFPTALITESGMDVANLTGSSTISLVAGTTTDNHVYRCTGRLYTPQTVANLSNALISCKLTCAGTQSNPLTVIGISAKLIPA